MTAIRDIYAHYVRHSLATFEETQVTLTRPRRWNGRYLRNWVLSDKRPAASRRGSFSP